MSRHISNIKKTQKEEITVGYLLCPLSHCKFLKACDSFLPFRKQGLSPRQEKMLARKEMAIHYKM